MERPLRVTLAEGAAAGALHRTAVSHIGFSVPDLTAAVDFYTRVLGMARHRDGAGGDVRLGWGAGHHVLSLREGPQTLTHYGFEVRDEDGLDGIRERLGEAGVDHHDLDADWVDEAVGRPDGISVTDPDGNTVHFHSPVRRHGENAADPGRRPIKFQHTTVGTADLARLVGFFVDVVGFRISDQLADGRFAWLRSDKDHHTLAVVETGRGGDIDHYSYDLSEWEDFKSWCDRLTELDVPVTWGPGRHGPGNNLFVFFDDPAGNHIELSAEMEKFYDDRVQYVPRRWTPAPQTVNLWGGQTPTWRRTSESSI
ncbi:VOC family protein [Kineococcus rhizosphaerae]|uniref:Catechol 2,3-dioxygenase-like lactoylglutathione lyase family enzyme n=1 Tax=Kineococcus rhizosphaerae TaxID=559628 RepID=A0A2T0RAV6_9ACTN|nr:VOC family protein [Kineococcus rhizosphaerae]PRY18294.1 catechol 2,3-dioxygenase-like lactoylglutathione lyase family enzyme [Kineococcus rhizosphaerae]